MPKNPAIKSETGINWKYEIEQYSFAIFAAEFFFVIFSLYIFFRRGYYDLFIANKVFAGVAAILIGIVLLIGPGSRMFSFPDRFIQYRKELGIVAFVLALIHSVVSLFFLPEKFPLSGYIGKINWPFIYGLTATILLTALFLISNNKTANSMGRTIWWRAQYLGIRIISALILLHVFVMKWDGWVSWYKKGGAAELTMPHWPGAGLLIGWFMAIVLFVRAFEFLNPKLGKFAWYASVILLPSIYIFTFCWGSQLK